jgi:hypothetical protein
MGKIRVMGIRNNKAMTLVEICVVCFVFIVVIGPLLACMTSLLYLIDIARCESTAISDLGSIMERIRSTPFNNMLTSFPDSDMDGPMSNSYSAIIGGYTLANEHITVTYEDTSVDPLELRVTATWEDKNGRSYSTFMSTFKTR